MRLSRKSDYALRAVRHLAGLPKGKLGCINSIAESEAIPREFLAKILRDLTRGGILVSYQGIKGGYAPARAPKEISFLDIIETIDGQIHLNMCTEPNGCRCVQYDTCQIRFFWESQEESFKKALGKQHFGRYRKGRK